MFKKHSFTAQFSYEASIAPFSVNSSSALDDYYYNFNSFSLTLAGTVVNFNSDGYENASGTAIGSYIHIRDAKTKGADHVSVRGETEMFSSTVRIDLFRLFSSELRQTYDNAELSTIISQFSDTSGNFSDVFYSVLDTNGDFVRDGRATASSLRLVNVVDAPGTALLFVLGVTGIAISRRKY